MPGRSLVVIGASAGGVQALQELAAGLPPDFPAALLIVLHIGTYPSILPKLLSARGPLPASHAADGAPLAAGHIHIAPPDHHLLVDGDRLRLSRGPKEHHARPAIDPLFRSAALAHGPSVVGVVLTGMLDDGTAGLQAINAGGGVAVVQSPEDAEQPSMPASALRYARIDHSVPLAQMAGLLLRLAREQAAPAPAVDGVPAHEHEHAISLSQGDPMQHLEAIATPSPFVCPDCKGGLWEIDGAKPPRFRCHTGHAFTLRSLQHAQAEATDEALWGALRALQERQLLLRRFATQQGNGSDAAAAAHREAQARHLDEQADALRRLVERAPEADDR